MEPPVRFVDKPDIFVVNSTSGKKKKDERKAPARKTYFNAKEEIKNIQNCRIKGSDPVSYKVEKDGNIKVTFEELQKSVQDLILKSKDSKKPFNRTKARSIAFAFDERGHLMPKEQKHMLNAQEMKELVSITKSISEKTKDTVNGTKPGLTAKKLLNLFLDLKENVLTPIADDYSARCPFVGQLTNDIWSLFEFVLTYVCNSTIELEKASSEAMNQSIKDIQLFKEKIKELSNKPPVIVEKEVIVEKKPSTTIIDRTAELEDEIKTKELLIKRMQNEVELAFKSKNVWKTASLELCNLVSPQIQALNIKESKWEKAGQNYIDTLKMKTSDIIQCSKTLTENWNEKAVVVFSLCCKAQSSVLLHFKLIADKCARYSQKIISDYDSFMLNSQDSTEEYSKFMLGGELEAMSIDFQAWGPSIEEWSELESTVGVIDARNISTSLTCDMSNLIVAFETFPYKKHIPTEIVPRLKEILKRMDVVCDYLTKPYTEQCRTVLTPIVKQIRDIAENTKKALDGVPCKYLLVNGVVDSLEVRAISFKLASFAKVLDHFVSEKTEVLQSLQTSIPKITFDISSINRDVSTPIENNIQCLQDELNENIEIAQAWALMYGAGCQGPFKLISQKTIGIDFYKSFGTKMKRWIDSLQDDFDSLLTSGSYEEFNLLLHDWFDYASESVNKNSVFYYSVDVQTDPVLFVDQSKDQEPIQEVQADDFVSSLKRCETQDYFDAQKLSNSGQILLFDQDPNYDVQKKRTQTRAHSFAKVKTLVITPDSPAMPMKPIPNAHPLSWGYKVITDFFKYRAENSIEVERGGIKYYISDINAADSFKNFAVEKGGKKTWREYLKQLNDTLSNSKSETDPLIYSAKLVKAGIWSKSTLNFMVSLFLNVNERTQINPLLFAEEMFAPFGVSPINSVRSVISLSSPSNADEVVYVCSFCFECLQRSKVCESISLYRKFSDKGGVSKDMFNGLAIHLQTSNPLPDTNLMIDAFYHNTSKLSEHDFRELCFYCGIFGASGVIVATDPFGCNKDKSLQPIREAIKSCDFEEATKMMAHIVNDFVEKASLDKYSSSECAFSLAHTLRICCRCIEGSTSSSTFITSGCNSEGGVIASSPLIE